MKQKVCYSTKCIRTERGPVKCTVPFGCKSFIPSSEAMAKPPYSEVSVERLVSRRACANGGQAETEGNAPISREAPQARAANTKGEARGARQGENHG